VWRVSQARGLEPEADADVVAIKTARGESSDEIVSRNGLRAESNVVPVGGYEITR
jgi:hypothetical protein